MEGITTLIIITIIILVLYLYGLSIVLLVGIGMLAIGGFVLYNVIKIRGLTSREEANRRLYSIVETGASIAVPEVRAAQVGMKAMGH